MQGNDFPFKHQYDWNHREVIGQGGFGVVYKVKKIKTGEEVAIKQMDMKKFDEDYKREALKSQIKAMQELVSPYTVRMYDYSYGYVYTYVVLQLCNSDLKAELQHHSLHFSQTESIKVFRDIMAGFKVLIDKGYIHRDIKPQNILVKDNVYKVADYGFSKKVIIDHEKLREICGTPLYMAPQLLYRKQYTSKCDIWSLGLLLYEMIFGYSPWSTRHVQVYKQAVVNKRVAFPYNCEIGTNVKNFIERSLELEQENRISWKEVFEHPLIKKGEIGPPVKHTQVDGDLLKMLIRVQQSSSRKFINLTSLFKEYQKYKSIDQKIFHQLMHEIDPQITSFENYCIFQAADTSKDGFVNLDEFRSFFVEVDYRPVEDIGARRIEQIVKMAFERNLNVRQFFDLFDKDKSSEIDIEEFRSFIKYIAPKICDTEIKLMWVRFDKDKSGKISMRQFVDQFTRSVPGQGSRIIENVERAKRNVMCLRDFLRSKKITAEQVFGKAKIEKGKTMKMQDFGPLIETINYVISKAEIVDMFRYIDRNGSGTIELQEISSLLGY